MYMTNSTLACWPWRTNGGGLTGASVLECGLRKAYRLLPLLWLASNWQNPSRPYAILPHQISCPWQRSHRCCPSSEYPPSWKEPHSLEVFQFSHFICHFLISSPQSFPLMTQQYPISPACDSIFTSQRFGSARLEGGEGGWRELFPCAQLLYGRMWFVL